MLQITKKSFESSKVIATTPLEISFLKSHSLVYIHEKFHRFVDLFWFEILQRTSSDAVYNNVHNLIAQYA